MTQRQQTGSQQPSKASMHENANSAAGGSIGSTDTAQQSQLRAKFKDASVTLFTLYKQSARAVESAYHQGKEDAFAEILKYVTGMSGASSSGASSGQSSYLPNFASASFGSAHCPAACHSQGISSLKYLPINEFISFLQSRYELHRSVAARPKPLSQVPPSTAGSERQQLPSQAMGLIEQLAEFGHRQAHAEGPYCKVAQRLPNLEFLKVMDSKKRRRIVGEGETSGLALADCSLPVSTLASPYGHSSHQRAQAVPQQHRQAGQRRRTNDGEILVGQRPTTLAQTQITSASLSAFSKSLTQQFNFNLTLGKEKSNQNCFEGRG